MLLGLMTSNLSVEEKYFTELAKVARQQSLDICRFTPQQIDIETKEIHAQVLDENQENWMDQKMVVPDFIYDRTFHGLTRETTDLTEKIKWLKKQSTFLGYGLPSKWEIYEALKNHPHLQAFLPKTSKIHTSEDMWKQLDEHERIVLKPAFGARGTGIYLVKKTNEGAIVTMTKKAEKYERSFQSKSHVNKWVDRLLQRYSYLCQPYLELSTAENHPFDLRVLLQKDHRNQWVERGRGIRLGQKDNITANIATGGLFLPVTTFLQTYPDTIPLAAEHTIQHILRTLPDQVEARFNRLFELGIDLGVDRNGQVWILDINSKPGRKIIESLYPAQYHQLYLAPILYCQYLAKSLLKAGE
jgi:glutathione synthase/RimK-type ligase-like ATP-grasp enzyme